MQLTILSPLQSRHLGHFLVNLQALGLELLWRLADQLQCQFPGKQVAGLCLGLKGLMQALGPVLRHGFPLGLGRQGVQRVQFGAQIGVLAQEYIQGKLKVFARFRQGGTPQIQVARPQDEACS